jgi:uncharacterized protein (TIGR02145 family)
MKKTILSLKRAFMAVLLATGATTGLLAQTPTQLNVTLKGGNVVTYELADIDSLWFSAKNEQPPVVGDKVYAISIPTEFTENDVLRVMADGKQVAEICLEYINVANQRLVVVYPMNEDGKADLSRGWCAEDGGSIAWDTEANTCLYTRGNGIPQEKVYLSDGRFTIASQDNAIATDVQPDLLVDKRGDEENIYRTVKIGTQYWMAQNLNARKYLTNSPLAFVKVAETNAWRTNTSGAYHIFADDESFADAFGVMYNGYALTNAAGLAPAGWEVPELDAFVRLKAYLGTQSGLKMKSTAIAAWNEKEDYEPNNLSGFSAIAAGYYVVSGDGDCGLGTDAWFWTKTEYDDPLTGKGLNTVRLNYATKALTIYDESGHDRALFGHSLRCIRK